MSKILTSVFICTLLLFSVTLEAAPANEKDREEIRALRIEKAKLHAKERLLFLKNALKLKQSQMTAWEAYSNHVKENSSNQMAMAAELRRKHAETGSLPTALELVDANISRLEHKLATAKQQRTVFSELYQVLDAKQRATVDKLTLRKIKKEAREVRKRRPKGRP